MRRANPAIIHFSGVGKKDKLLFENETGNVHYVKTQPLVDLLTDFAPQVKCVFLNARYSQVIAQKIANHANHIDYTIGYPKGASDKHHINFSREFYTALNWRKSFEQAYKLGRIQLQMDKISENNFPILNRKRD